MHPTEHLTDCMLLGVLELSPEATAIYSSEDLHIRFVNKAMLTIWGKERTVVGKTFEEAIPEIKGQPFTDLLQEVWRSGKSYFGKDMPADLVVSGKLQTFYFDFEYRAIPDASGATYCLLHTARDVTERHKAERKLKESGQTNRQLDDQLASRNRLLNLANEELLEIAKQNTEALEQVELAKKATKLGIFDLDVKHDRLIWDSRCKELFGVPEEKEVSYGHDFLNGLHPDDRDGIEKAIQRAYNFRQSKGHYDVTYRVIDASDNTERWIHALGQVYFDERELPLRFIGSVRDVTVETTAIIKLEENESRLQEANEELEALNEEQALVNEELRAANTDLNDIRKMLLDSNNRLIESEDRIRSFFEQAPVGICVLRGPDHVIEMANERILKVWGRRMEDVLGKPHHIARPELIGQPVYQWLDDVFNSGEVKINDEFRVMLSDGDGLREAFVNSIYSPLRNANAEVVGVLVILDEITERIRARQEARRTQDMFQMAIEAGGLGTYYYDPLSDQFSANEVLKSWFGLTPQDKIDLKDAIAVIAEKDRQAVAEAIKSALRVESGGSYEIEYTIINSKTKEVRIVRASGKTIFSKEGKAISLNGTLQDITERKREEQRKNDFIAMVSHELKTPLTSIKAYTQMLEAKAAKTSDDFAAGALSKVGKQVKKMTSMINGFLNVSRLESGNIHIDKTTFSLSELISEINDEFSMMSSGHTICFAEVPDLQLLGDRDKIGQVINNLISNAIKYSVPGSKVEIRAAKEGDNAVISVKDYGMGIKQEDQARLFSRFYRVEGSQMLTISGFGIGLYLCAEIIHLHGGEIWLDSEFGKGSVFSFSLPLGTPQ